MSHPPTSPRRRSSTRSVLSASDRRVLAYIAVQSQNGAPVSLSLPKIARALGLSRSQVQFSVARLNDLRLLRTAAGGSVRVSVHEVLAPHQVQFSLALFAEAAARKAAADA